MILHDPYAGHRKWWDCEWKPELGDDAWTEWDYVLADIYQVIDDFTSKSNGQWIPDDVSGDVWWEVQSMFSGHDAAIDAARKERKELEPGETLYAIPVFDENKPKPTLQSMMLDIEDGAFDRRPAEVRDARPPTPKELASMGKR